jgi:hypothetical protein
VKIGYRAAASRASEKMRGWRHGLSAGDRPAKTPSGYNSLLIFRFFQNRKKIPAAMHDSFDSDYIMADAKEDHVIAYGGHSSFSAKFGPEPVDPRLFGDLLHSSAEQS